MVALRIRRWMAAMTGFAVTELEASHPEAVLDYEREQLRVQIAQYNRNLAGHAGLCERLRARGAKLAKEEEALRARIERFLDAGKRDRGAELALRLEQLVAEREELAGQLEIAEQTYEQLVVSRDAAIESARTKLERLKRTISDVEVQSALAELLEMSSCMQGGIGVCDGTLERVHEKLEERRELAVGRARVAGDQVDVDRVAEDEEERAMLAEEARARFEEQRTGGDPGLSSGPAADPR